MSEQNMQVLVVEQHDQPSMSKMDNLAFIQIGPDNQVLHDWSNVSFEGADAPYPELSVIE